VDVKSVWETVGENINISAKENLCKSCSFYSSDYEEWRLLGYKDPVRTSQETLLLRYRDQQVNAM
jgi:hypothetical protein